MRGGKEEEGNISLKMTGERNKAPEVVVILDDSGEEFFLHLVGCRLAFQR